MPCEAYCEHGGVCELDEGHAGPHDTGYCTFEAGVSKEEADAKLIQENGAFGEMLVSVYDATLAALKKDCT